MDNVSNLKLMPQTRYNDYSRYYKILTTKNISDAYLSVCEKIIKLESLNTYSGTFEKMLTNEVISFPKQHNFYNKLFIEICDLLKNNSILIK